MVNPKLEYIKRRRSQHSLYTQAVTSLACDTLKFKMAEAEDVLAKGLSETCEVHVGWRIKLVRSC